MNDPGWDKQGCGMAVKVWHGSLRGSSSRWGKQEGHLYNHPGGANRQINRLGIWWRKAQKDPFSLISVPVKTSVVALTRCSAPSPQLWSHRSSRARGCQPARPADSRWTCPGHRLQGWLKPLLEAGAGRVCCRCAVLENCATWGESYRRKSIS